MKLLDNGTIMFISCSPNQHFRIRSYLVFLDNDIIS